MKLAASCLVIFAWSVLKESTGRSIMNTIQHSYKTFNNAHSERLPMGDAFSSLWRKLSRPSQNGQRVETNNTKDMVNKRSKREIQESFQRLRRTADLTDALGNRLDQIFTRTQMNLFLTSANGETGLQYNSNAFGNNPTQCPSVWSRIDVYSDDVLEVNSNDIVYPR